MAEPRMTDGAEGGEAEQDGGRRQPSWLSLRIGLPIAVIVIGLGLGILWKQHVGVLARATVRLGGREFELKLVDSEGVLYGDAMSGGGRSSQYIAALDAGRGLGGPLLARQEIRDARVVIDRQRQEARFVLKGGEIVFDRTSFSLRGFGEKP
jgi:hypothetical protein